MGLLSRLSGNAEKRILNTTEAMLSRFEEGALDPEFAKRTGALLKALFTPMVAGQAEDAIEFAVIVRHEIGRASPDQLDRFADSLMKDANRRSPEAQFARAIAAGAMKAQRIVHIGQRENYAQADKLLRRLDYLIMDLIEQGYDLVPGGPHA
jgi:hypothetical protein